MRYQVEISIKSPGRNGLEGKIEGVIRWRNFAASQVDFENG